MDLLTKQDVANSLGVSVATVDRLTRTGELHSIKIGKHIKSPVRYDPVDVRDFVNARRNHGRNALAQQEG